MRLQRATRLLAGLCGLAGAVFLFDASASDAPGAPAAAAGLIAEAVRHEHGEGLAKKPVRAAELYCSAAAMGSADAAYRLGWMHANGRGLARDDGIAVALFQRAAAQGHVSAGRALQKIRAEPARLPACIDSAGGSRSVAAGQPETVVVPSVGKLREDARALNAQLDATRSELAKMQKLLLEERARVESAKAALAELAALPALPALDKRAATAGAAAASTPASPATGAPAPATAGLKEIAEAVGRWSAAWSRKDMDAYLAAYASDFLVPAGRGRSQWEQERRARIVGREWIAVKVEALEITLEGEAAKARFLQDYRSDNYSERSAKTLALVRSGGKWLIRQERSEP